MLYSYEDITMAFRCPTITDAELLKTDFSKEARCRISDWRNYCYMYASTWRMMTPLQRLALYVECEQKAQAEEWD